jgi:prolyl oligopeptidase
LKKLIIPIAISCIQIVVAQAQKPAPSIPEKDTYHGVEIVDEYRNLENLEDTAVVDWMKNQTTFAESVLKNISNRDRFIKRVKKLNSKSKFFYGGAGITRDQQYFYTKMKNDDTYRKLYHRQRLNGKIIKVM